MTSLQSLCSEYTKAADDIISEISEILQIDSNIKDILIQNMYNASKKDLENATTENLLDRVAVSNVIEILINPEYGSISDELFNIYVLQQVINAKETLDKILLDIVKCQSAEIQKIIANKNIKGYNILRHGIVISNTKIDTYKKIRDHMYVVGINILNDCHPINIWTFVPLEHKNDLDSINIFDIQCKNALFWATFNHQNIDLFLKDLNSNKVNKITISKNLIIKNGYMSIGVHNSFGIYF